MFKGYRELNKSEIEIIEGIKDAAEAISNIVQSLESLEISDKRWVAIAKTDLQKGFMALTRSVAKPDSF